MFVRSRLRLFFVLAAFLVVFGACSFGGDDDDDGDETPTSTTVSGVETATSTAEPTETEPTEEPTATATETATATATSTPEPTNTPTPSPTPSPTPEPIVTDPFGSIQLPDTVLQNFTLEYSTSSSGGEQSRGSLGIYIEQFNPNQFYVRTEGDEVSGVEAVEIWVTADATFFRPPGGEVSEIPGAMDSTLFSPGAYLILTPDLSDVPEATDLGTEEVNGIVTRHYRFDAEDMDDDTALPEESELTDPQGEVDVWIDEERGIAIRMEGDVSWEDENGERIELELFYELSAIDSTAEIQPPV